MELSTVNDYIQWLLISIGIICELSLYTTEIHFIIIQRLNKIFQLQCDFRIQSIIILSQ